MILDFNPNNYPRSPSPEWRYIGFWAPSKDGSVVPTGNRTLDAIRSRDAQRESDLPFPENYIDRTWDPSERRLVVAYLNDCPQGSMYRGSSRCRICGILNGAADRHDDVYIWPSGFAHYIAEHGVRPPDEFVQHVLRQIAAGSR